MDESPHRGSSRVWALLLVLVLHAGLVLIVWNTPAARSAPVQAQAAPIEVVLLPPKAYPKLKLQISIARQLGGNAAITVAAPRLDGTAVAASPGPVAAISGSQDGVDWAAEARRELQAMEIRRNRNPGINTISMRLGEDYWMAHAKHFPGDQLKTANGDWIVWLSDDCYQIATAAPTRATTQMIIHESVCRESRSQPYP